MNDDLGGEGINEHSFGIGQVDGFQVMSDLGRRFTTAAVALCQGSAQRLRVCSQEEADIEQVFKGCPLAFAQQ